LDAEALKTRLSHVLDTFVAFAGVPHRPSSTIRIPPGAAVPFGVAEYDGSAESVLHVQHPGSGSESPLSALYVPLGAPWAAPLFSMKLTHCNDGHSILGVALSHLAGDGESLWALVEMLAEIPASIGALGGGPSRGRADGGDSSNRRKSGALLGMVRGRFTAKLPASSVGVSPLRPVSSHVVTALFPVPTRLIEHIKHLAVTMASEGSVGVSPFGATYASTGDILTALAWSLFREALPVDVQNDYTLSATVSLRGGNGGLPLIHAGGLVGNAVFSTYVDPVVDGFDALGLNATEVSRAALAIRSRLLEWRASVGGLLELASGDDFNPMEHEALALPCKPIFNVTSWAGAPTRVALKKVDGATVTPAALSGSTLSADPTIAESPPYRGYVMPLVDGDDTRAFQLLCPSGRLAWLRQRWEAFALPHL
jgi:hypothetical protein